MVTTFFGYLEGPYLIGPYMLAAATATVNVQATQTIQDFFDVRSQVNRMIETFTEVNTESERFIDDVSQEILTQANRAIESVRSIETQASRGTSDEFDILTQAQRTISTVSDYQTQATPFVTSSVVINEQASRRITDSFNTMSQARRSILTGLKSVRSEAGRGPVSHQHCGGYLVDPYLVVPYLAPQICAHMRTQVEAMLENGIEVPTQASREIETVRRIRSQVRRQVVETREIPMQVLRQSSTTVHTQVLRSIYTTDNIRILYEFPSRGTDGLNWTVIAGGTEPGDFTVNNLNTDIVEQVYRSLATTITIQSDTAVPQGIFNDTLGMLNHNLTTSATVTMQASNDPLFSSVPFSEALTVERENLYWVSEFLPMSSFRYWRFVISDSTNPDGYIQIGTIVFGNAVIFNGECMVDELTRRKTHFADRVKTEAFSNVSNDRALKRSVSLTFRRLSYLKENYQNLTTVIDTVRTSLKALWLPTPRFASRFAVFGKLAEIPAENHKVIGETSDWIDLDITVDEAL